MSRFQDGNSIRVSIGEVLIGGQIDCTINRNTDFIEVTTKDAGLWSEEEVGGLNWDVALNGFVVNGDEGLEALHEAWRTGATVDVKYGKPEKYETGKAKIESYSNNSAAKEKTTYDVALKGIGELKYNN
jgi:TP901-1 family phage major tail protein